MANTNLLHVSELVEFEVLKMTRPDFWVYAFLGQNPSFLTLGLDSGLPRPISGLGVRENHTNLKKCLAGFTQDFRP